MSHKHIRACFCLFVQCEEAELGHIETCSATPSLQHGKPHFQNKAPILFWTYQKCLNVTLCSNTVMDMQIQYNYLLPNLPEILSQPLAEGGGIFLVVEKLRPDKGLIIHRALYPVDQLCFWIFPHFHILLFHGRGSRAISAESA